MRRIVIAPSFDEELLAISAYIEAKFGERAADEFEDRFRSISRTLAHAPLIGRTTHGYNTSLFGFIMSPCWVFYRFTDDDITFIHIRDGRMHKPLQTFSE